MMKENKGYSAKVREFSQACNKNKLPTGPRLISIEDVDFIRQMVSDEMQELLEAESSADQADALVDAIYYICDMAARHGINLDPIFDIVHVANMQKVVLPVPAPPVMIANFVDVAKLMAAIWSSLRSISHRPGRRTFRKMNHLLESGSGYYFQPEVQGLSRLAASGSSHLLSESLHRRRLSAYWPHGQYQRSDQG